MGSDVVKELGSDKLTKFVFKKLTLSLAILFSLICVQWTLLYGFSHSNPDRIEINLKNENSEEEQGCILIRDIDYIGKEFPSGNLTYIREEKSLLTVNYKSYPVNIALTGYLYPHFANIKLARGCYFTPEACNEGRKVVVISTELALKLFSTCDVIGSQISFSNNEKYKIIGLYDQAVSALNFLSSDGTEQVYIPYESYPNYRTLPIKTLILSDEKLQNDKFRVNKLSNSLKSWKISSGQYRINDYYNASANLIQPVRFLLFSLCIITILYLLKYYAKFMRYSLDKIKNHMDNMYFLELIRAKGLIILKLFIITAAFFISVLIIFILGRFMPNVNLELIPPDNIFDIKFYLYKITSAIQNANSSHGIIPSRFELEFITAKKIIAVLSILTFVSIISVVSSVNLFIRINGFVHDFLKASAISILLTVLVCILNVILFRTQFVFPVKEILILILFILSKYIPRTAYIERMCCSIQSTST